MVLPAQQKTWLHGAETRRSGPTAPGSAALADRGPWAGQGCGAKLVYDQQEVSGMSVYMTVNIHNPGCKTLPETPLFCFGNIRSQCPRFQLPPWNMKFRGKRVLCGNKTDAAAEDEPHGLA